MILALFQLFAAVPVVTVLLVVVGTWLLRRRAGRPRHAWIVGIGTLLVAADAAEEVEPLPLPEPKPWLSGGTAIPARHTVEFGGGGGQFQTCAGPRTYADVGAMYRYTTPISAQTNLTASAGSYGALSWGTPSGGVRGSVGLEHRWIGGSVGVLAGALKREDTVDAPVLPTATLRLGPRDMVFLDANLFDVSPAPLPGAVLELGGGVAFPKLGNRWEPFRVRAGMSLAGVYVAPTIPLWQVGNVDVIGAYGDPSTWGVSARIRLHFDAVP